MYSYLNIWYSSRQAIRGRWSGEASIDRRRRGRPGPAGCARSQLIHPSRTYDGVAFAGGLQRQPLRLWWDPNADSLSLIVTTSIGRRRALDQASYPANPSFCRVLARMNRPDLFYFRECAKWLHISILEESKVLITQLPWNKDKKKNGLQNHQKPTIEKNWKPWSDMIIWYLH